MVLRLQQDGPEPDSDVMMHEVNPEMAADSSCINRSSAVIKVSDVSRKAAVKPVLPEPPSPPQSTTQYFRSCNAVTEGAGMCARHEGVMHVFLAAHPDRIEII